MLLSYLSDLSIQKEQSNKTDFYKREKQKGGVFLDPIFYTVQSINGDYAGLVADDGQRHSITMFLLPEGTTLGSRLKLENFMWELIR